MSKSIMSNDKFCYICGTPLDLHRHHIYGGHGRRTVSEREGCWVYLCAKHHNMSPEGVHNSKVLDEFLKQRCQLRWEAKNGTREDFIRTFGRSYL